MLFHNEGTYPLTQLLLNLLFKQTPRLQGFALRIPYILCCLIRIRETSLFFTLIAKILPRIRVTTRQYLKTGVKIVRIFLKFFNIILMTMKYH